jgi:hypothetical protein
MEETIKKDFLFGLTAQKHSLGHIVPPKQEKEFWLTSGVTNLKKHQGSKPPTCWR